MRNDDNNNNNNDNNINSDNKLHRGYYMVARRYEFYFRVAKQNFTNERSQ